VKVAGEHPRIGVTINGQDVEMDLTAVLSTALR